MSRLKILFNFKLYLIFISVFMLSLSSISFVFSGTLEHKILSPFGNVIATEQNQYYSGLTKKGTTTIIDSKFKDFQEYSDDDIQEPFCRIGGQYNITVHNDALPGAQPQNYTFKLFYCKTTKDLIDLVKIPKSWKDDDLLVYCNDGKDIQSESTNFDLFTSKINTYKVCIVKNLNLTSDNTILFGFEIGNHLIDTNKVFYFNTTSKTGPVLVDFQSINLMGKGSTVQTVYAGMVEVPFKQITAGVNSNPSSQSSTSTSTSTTSSSANYVKRTYSEALAWTKSNNFPNAKSLSFVKDVGQKSVYLVKKDVTFDSYLYNMTYNNPNKEKFYFYYDSGQNFYILTNFEYDLNNDFVFLKDVFPDYVQIGLSRVALFYKSGNKYIYGYENPTRLLTTIFGDSILPAYIIKFENYAGITKDKCGEVLSKYDPLSLFSAGSELLCDNNIIVIVSNNLVVTDKSFIPYNLFKNIILEFVNIN